MAAGYEERERARERERESAKRGEKFKDVDREKREGEENGCCCPYASVQCNHHRVWGDHRERVIALGAVRGGV
jgi:hypothetical protein